MNTGEYFRVEKIYVPSMKTTDLLHWLNQLQPNTKISRLVVHIGVNDCKGGEIKAEQWITLLTKIKTTFPAASLIVSSIIPARGKHLMNPAILSPNRNLHSVCDALKITFVDNTSTFVAKSNECVCVNRVFDLHLKPVSHRVTVSMQEMAGQLTDELLA